MSGTTVINEFNIKNTVIEMPNGKKVNLLDLIHDFCDVTDGEDVGDLMGMTALSSERCEQIVQNRQALVPFWLNIQRPGGE